MLIYSDHACHYNHERAMINITCVTVKSLKAAGLHFNLSEIVDYGCTSAETDALTN